MCLGEVTWPTLEEARTDEEYVLALAAVTRRGGLRWRRSVRGEWRGTILVRTGRERSVTVRGGAGGGVLQSLDGDGRSVRAIAPSHDDAPLLLALTRLLVAIRWSDAGVVATA